MKSIDAPTNRLTVELQGGTERTYDPRRQRGVSVFRPELRGFSVGDRMQFTAPANELKVANRDLGTIESIGPDGRLGLRMDGGRTVELDPRKHPHLDHGYAMTRSLPFILPYVENIVNTPSAALYVVEVTFSSGFESYLRSHSFPSALSISSPFRAGSRDIPTSYRTKRSAEGNECVLAAGDVPKRLTNIPNRDQKVNATFSVASASVLYRSFKYRDAALVAFSH